jgi:hypothetical protein
MWSLPIRGVIPEFACSDRKATKISVTVADVKHEILTEDLPNTSQHSYLCVNLFRLCRSKCVAIDHAPKSKATNDNLTSARNT